MLKVTLPPRHPLPHPRQTPSASSLRSTAPSTPTSSWPMPRATRQGPRGDVTRHAWSAAAVFACPCQRRLPVVASVHSSVCQLVFVNWSRQALTSSGLQVAQTVGVYYASNAVGRLVGTLASGGWARVCESHAHDAGRPSHAQLPGLAPRALRDRGASDKGSAFCSQPHPQLAGCPAPLRSRPCVRASPLPPAIQTASCTVSTHRPACLPCRAGALYSYVGSTVVDGFGACLMVSVGFAALSCAIDLFLHDDHTRGEQSCCTPWSPSSQRLLPALCAAVLLTRACWQGCCCPGRFRCPCMPSITARTSHRRVRRRPTAGATWRMHPWRKAGRAGCRRSCHRSSSG